MGLTATTPSKGNDQIQTITKRIGSTTYVVAVHFSKDSKETLEDKLLRLMKCDPLVCSSHWPGGQVGVQDIA